MLQNIGLIINYEADSRGGTETNLKEKKLISDEKEKRTNIKEMKKTKEQKSKWWKRILTNIKVMKKTKEQETNELDSLDSFAELYKTRRKV